VTHALMGDQDFDASEDGTGRGTPLVMATLNSGDHDGGFRTEPGEHLVFDTDEWDISPDETQAPTRQISSGSSAGAAPIAQSMPSQRHGTAMAPVGTATVRPMSAAIRRLTPVECERLQGFSDGWTCLCQPLAAYAEPDAAALRCRCPDGPRYQAMGNAVTVPVIAWLGRRLRATMSLQGRMP
jgi:DNA (cytosine-5)-methyltransferase 1